MCAQLDGGLREDAKGGRTSFEDQDIEHVEPMLFNQAGDQGVHEGAVGGTNVGEIQYDLAAQRQIRLDVTRPELDAHGAIGQMRPQQIPYGKFVFHDLNLVLPSRSCNSPRPVAGSGQVSSHGCTSA